MYQAFNNWLRKLFPAAHPINMHQGRFHRWLKRATPENLQCYILGLTGRHRWDIFISQYDIWELPGDTAYTEAVVYHRTDLVPGDRVKLYIRGEGRQIKRVTKDCIILHAWKVDAPFPYHWVICIITP